MRRALDSAKIQSFRKRFDIILKFKNFVHFFSKMFPYCIASSAPMSTCCEYASSGLYPHVAFSGIFFRFNYACEGANQVYYGRRHIFSVRSELANAAFAAQFVILLVWSFPFLIYFFTPKSAFLAVEYRGTNPISKIVI